MDGLFIATDRAGNKEITHPLARHALLTLDVFFTYFLSFYLVILYFTMMSHTIYKFTNEYQGNNDFYVSSSRQT